MGGPLHRMFLFLSGWLLATSLLAQSPRALLRAELQNHSHAMADLQVLCDEYGPRLTGSESLRKAQAWAMQKLKEYGAEQVHEEAYDFARSWTRGTDSARLLTQSGMRLNVAAMAWNPGTQGPIRAEVVDLEGPATELIPRLLTAKGKILRFGNIEAPKVDPTGEVRGTFVKTLKDCGAVAILWAGNHRDGKMTMMGSPKDDYFTFLPPFPRLPFGFIQPEHGLMLHRLLQAGKRVELELNLGGTFSSHPVQATNVVGEILGSEKPEEVVIIGGHLDSWDLGQGASDNGTGAIAALETLRAIKASGVKPKRTLRVVLFSGEEQGEYGSKAYVKAHEKELANVQAVLVHDSGSGKVKGFTVQGREDLIPFLSQAITPLASTGVTDIPFTLHEQSDQDPFVELGLPGFFAVQEDSDYNTSLHHSQVDTFDRVKAEDYLQGIQAIAQTGLFFANLEARLPHRKPE